MKAQEISAILSGAILLGYLLASIFFIRFWRQTRERLFACFAVAFFILFVERILLIPSSPFYSHSPHLYLTRLVAFVMIIWGIWDKNRPTLQ